MAKSRKRKAIKKVAAPRKRRLSAKAAGTRKHGGAGLRTIGKGKMV